MLLTGLTARQSNNYSRVSTADTGFSLNWYGHLFIKNVCLKYYFLTRHVRVSSMWTKNIKASSELQLLNPKIPIWYMFLQTSTTKKKLTISSTERDI